MLFVVGASHKTAPLATRERLAVAPERVPELLDGLLESKDIDEAVLLSTCNRSELYVEARAQTKRLLIDWLGHLGGPPEAEWENYYYARQDGTAARHLFRVAAGLESMVPGETHIQGQVKTAYQIAHHAATVGPQLHHLFQHALNTAKAIRTDSSLNTPRSLPYVATKLAGDRLDGLRAKTALLIGAGDTVRTLAFHLREQGIGRLLIANRSHEAAASLLAAQGDQALTLRDIPAALAEADLVASATASERPLLDKRSFRYRQPGKPLLLLDLAVPRDIAPEVADLAGIQLVSVDDLAATIDAGRATRDGAIEKAEAAIEPALIAWRTARRIRSAVPTICALRAEAAHLRRETLAEARRIETTRGSDAALEYLASTLTNRLLHAPTVRLREAAAREEGNLIAAAHDLFALETSEEDQSDDAAA
jgi:glutamyl-tRNA reductase